MNTIQEKNLKLITKRVVEVSEREWTVAPAPRKTSRPNSIASIGHTAFICHFVVLSGNIVQYGALFRFPLYMKEAALTLRATERPPSRNQEFRERAAKEKQDATTNLDPSSSRQSKSPTGSDETGAAPK